jgi:predicted AlkP superfamily phosphohydrolase/phosphomutase
MMPAYDWSRTRAFSLPTDQHGWIRINLLGREAQGIVPLNQYESTCEELERLLRSLMTADGRALVHDVLRTVVVAADAQSVSLPDLVVHWENAAFESLLEIKGSRVKTQPIGTKFTGQHSLDGFCIIRGVEDFQGTDCVRVSELGQAITRILVQDGE